MFKAYKTSDKMPQRGQLVIIAGGVGTWDGEKWISKTGDDTGRTINWNVQWWAEVCCLLGTNWIK